MLLERLAAVSQFDAWVIEVDGTWIRELGEGGTGSCGGGRGA